ncbi:MAG: hypothetical protein QM762_23570 [Chryseolinea sp.]
MDFESYLTSKRIDSIRFKSAEPEMWQSWRTDFEQMHPNSFTVQKLNLINPVRRKYQLVVTEMPKVAVAEAPKAPSAPVSKPATVVKPAMVAKPAVKIPRPGMTKIVKPESTGESAITSGSSPSPVVGSTPVASAQSADGSSAIDNSRPDNEASSPTSSADASTDALATSANAFPTSTDDSNVEAKPVADTPPPAAKPPRPVIPRPVIKPKPKPN